MLTKQDQCALGMMVCLFGMAIMSVVIVGGWVVQQRPVTFWLAVIAGCIGALAFFAMRWAREWRAWRRTRREPRIEPTYICLRCGYYAYSRAAIDEHWCSLDGRKSAQRAQGESLRPLRSFAANQKHVG